jgi:hypothetical protein
VTFTNTRWLKPIDRFREDLYLYSPKGAQYTVPTVCARAGALARRQRMAGQSAANGRKGSQPRSKNTIGTSTPTTPTIHGRRGTGILARAEQGYDVDQIANDIGMSRQNVDHYMRFRDQMKAGADGQKQLRLVTRED